MDIQLNNYLKKENIIFEIDATTRNAALDFLTKQLEKSGGGFNSSAAIAALKERENVLPTVIAPGVALPHARLAGSEQPMIAIATTRAGILFDIDQPPVHLILLVLTPKNDPSSYLRVLSLLVSILKDINVPEFISTATADSITALFNAAAGNGKDYLVAADVMNSEPITLLESDTLQKAIATLSACRILDVPVIDGEGDMRGVVSTEDILRQSLPEHLLWLEDLTPILRFEPFAEMMKKDNETKLADFMRENFVSVAPETPAVQLAKIFLKRDVRQIYVLEKRRLIGVVDLSGFSTKLFWA
ncbi:MAG: PTS sugar transporter subunit IIA [Kiritimatiellales bacterium]